MTQHFFENDFVNLHYYKFGSGPKSMLCFHGYGMHGKQFKPLEPALGDTYTFYGFDLFFHKETKLKDQSLPRVKQGIGKKEIAALITEFCAFEDIGRFSVIGYSMGSHFATTIAEELGSRIDEYIVAAPSSLNPGKLIPFFSKNKIGNKILEKFAMNGQLLVGMLGFFKRMRIINEQDYGVLYNEIGTPELRFNFFACFAFLRFLETDEKKLLQSITENQIKSIFIFGKKDKTFPPQIGNRFIANLPDASVVILDEGHELIKKEFVTSLTRLLK